MPCEDVFLPVAGRPGAADLVWKEGPWGSVGRGRWLGSRDQWSAGPGYEPSLADSKSMPEGITQDVLAKP